MQKAGIKNIAIFDDKPDDLSKGSLPGTLCGGMIDNFSRICVAHGEDFAKELWQFSHHAFDYLQNFLISEALNHKTNMRLRLITSLAELKEASKACKSLRNAGFECQLIKPGPNHPLTNGLGGEVLAVQREDHRGGWVDLNELHLLLEKEIGFQMLKEKITSIKSLSREIQIKTKNAQYHSELVVFCSGYSANVFLPELKEVFVPIVDQWQVYEWDPTIQWQKPGLFFTSNHTYEWGVSLDNKKVVVGGGRYKRKFAGIASDCKEYQADIELLLAEKCKKYFKIPTFQPQPGHLGRSFIDYRPCDELPVIGPLFGDERVLIAEGFMGNSVVLGFFAGQCLSELISKGQAKQLPRKLWPQRLRSLGEK